jgi:hypothetical protein
MQIQIFVIFIRSKIHLGARRLIRLRFNTLKSSRLMLAYYIRFEGGRTRDFLFCLLFCKGVVHWHVARLLRLNFGSPILRSLKGRAFDLPLNPHIGVRNLCKPAHRV